MSSIEERTHIVVEKIINELTVGHPVGQNLGGVPLPGWTESDADWDGHSLESGPLVYLIYESDRVMTRYDMRRPEITTDFIKEMMREGVGVVRVVMAWEFEEITLVDNNPVQNQYSKKGTPKIGPNQSRSESFLLFDIQDKPEKKEIPFPYIRPNVEECEKVSRLDAYIINMDLSSKRTFTKTTKVPNIPRRYWWWEGFKESDYNENGKRRV